MRRRLFLSLVLVTGLTGLILHAGADAQDKKATAKKKQDAKAPPVKKEATAAEDLQALPGFRVELIHTADPATEGSFINLAKDERGRLIIAGQRNQPILRLTIADGRVANIQKLDLPLSEAMGLLHAFGHLYVNANGPQGFGLYKCKEEGDTGHFSLQFLKAFAGAGEHGPHGLAIGPDNKIYIINGNHTKLPDGIAETSPHRNYREDHLLPRQWDGRGHAAGILAPGGYIVRTDADGKTWELMVGGFRNAYDIAFNPDGEIFTYDSDMEWDWGMPWYRPTRINHCVSGAEFGWRSGTGKWPDYYADSLPATVDIGIGSPTGVSNGMGAKFPAKYQRAIFVCDWTFGRLIAVHLTPNGASYKATWENFIAPKGLTQEAAKKRPLNLTDVIIGNDGAMYFTVGGRNTQAALYRVVYEGKDSTAPAFEPNPQGKESRALRHQLEQLHHTADAQKMSLCWDSLKHADAFVRYAARIALERQPVDTWKAKLASETEPYAAMTGALALARVGTPADQPSVYQALARFPTKDLSEELQLLKLRTLQVSFARHGKPAREWVQRGLEKLAPLFPGSSERINRELAQILIYLDAPGIAGKVLKHMAQAKTLQDRMHYLFHLRTLPVGSWTLQERKDYFAYWTADRTKLGRDKELERWFQEANRGYSEGNSMAPFLANFLREAVSLLSEEERKALDGQLKSIDAQATAGIPEPKQRPFVKKWTAADLEGQLDWAEGSRNYDRGRAAYIDAQCAKCHRVGMEGGAVGPELTAIAARFSRKDMLESILEPSKTLSDQYQNETFTTAGGQVITGRLVNETAEVYEVQPEPLSPRRVTIKKADVETRVPSKLSPMPEHLMDVLPLNDIIDLLAYMESGGAKNHRNYRKR
jgi:putative heme-binding domain-containing protein